jgi:hypothetical protein
MSGYFCSKAEQLPGLCLTWLSEYSSTSAARYELIAAAMLQRVTQITEWPPHPGYDTPGREAQSLISPLTATI